MRSVCVPLAEKLTVADCDSQYAPFCHPQPLRLAPVPSVARFTSSPAVLFSGYALEPPTTASENCRPSPTLFLDFFSARSRSHTVYGVSALALNVTATNSDGHASALEVLGMPASVVTSF